MHITFSGFMDLLLTVVFILGKFSCLWNYLSAHKHWVCLQVTQVAKEKSLNCYLGRPYKTRIAVTSQRVVGLYGCALMSIAVPSLGRLENWSSLNAMYQKLLIIGSKEMLSSNQKKICWSVIKTEHKTGNLTVLSSSERQSPLVSGMW